MAWEEIRGSWREMRGIVRERWGKLTDADVDQIAGQRDQLVGTLQRQYGSTRGQIEVEVMLFERKMAEAFGRVTDRMLRVASPAHSRQGEPTR